MDEWMETLWYIYTIREFYSAIKINNIEGRFKFRLSDCGAGLSFLHYTVKPLFRKHIHM